MAPVEARGTGRRAGADPCLNTRGDSYGLISEDRDSRGCAKANQSHIAHVFIGWRGRSCNGPWFLALPAFAVADDRRCRGFRALGCSTHEMESPAGGGVIGRAFSLCRG